MSVPFLARFVEQVLGRLMERGQIEIEAGSEARVIHEVAGALGGLGHGHSLISSLSRALLACDAVHELYADDDQLKMLISDLGVGWIRQ